MCMQSNSCMPTPSNGAEEVLKEVTVGCILLYSVDSIVLCAAFQSPKSQLG